MSTDISFGGIKLTPLEPIREEDLIDLPFSCEAHYHPYTCMKCGEHKEVAFIHNKRICEDCGNEFKTIPDLLDWAKELDHE